MGCTSKMSDQWLGNRSCYAAPMALKFSSQPKPPFPGIAKTWDWDCSPAILGLQMPLGSGASYSFNPRIAREFLKSTQRVPQSQDCTKFQDCVGCTILGLRVRNRGCCAHNTRTRKRTQIWQQTRGGWAAVGNTKRRNTNTREIREEQMDRPAAVGRGRFKPLVIVIVIAALRHDQL